MSRLAYIIMLQSTLMLVLMKKVVYSSFVEKVYFLASIQKLEKLIIKFRSLTEALDRDLRMEIIDSIYMESR